MIDFFFSVFYLVLCFYAGYKVYSRRDILYTHQPVYMMIIISLVIALFFVLLFKSVVDFPFFESVLVTLKISMVVFCFVFLINFLYTKK